MKLPKSKKKMRGGMTQVRNVLRNIIFLLFCEKRLSASILALSLNHYNMEGRVHDSGCGMDEKCPIYPFQIGWGLDGGSQGIHGAKA
jgi:hypothetical protein